MRVFELTSGINIPLSIEESDVLSDIMSNGRIYHTQMDERVQEVARLMVSRGIIKQNIDRQGKAYYTSRNSDVWRI